MKKLLVLAAMFWMIAMPAQARIMVETDQCL